MVPSSSTPPASVREDTAVEALIANLRVDVDGTVISIGFTAADPQEAARIVNAYATQYVDDQLKDKTAATEQATGWLGQRIQELRAVSSLRKCDRGVPRRQQPA